VTERQVKIIIHLLMIVSALKTPEHQELSSLTEYHIPPKLQETSD
jgi:hypothetical protein